MNSVISESPMCVGCLSADRKLQVLNEECKQMYFGFLDLFNPSQPMSLCFECTALLEKMVRFKKQVKQAYICFFTKVNNKTRKTLSKLESISIVTFDNFSHKQTEDPSFLIIYPKDKKNIQQHPSVRDTVKDEKHFDQKTNNDYLETKNYDQEAKNSDQEAKNYDQETIKNNYTEPLAFIKVEDVDVEDDNDVGFDVQNVKEAECKDSEFFDSDDEPLTMKSKKYKEKKKSKKIKNESPPKRRRGKEQAAGVVNDPRVAKKLRDLNIGPGHIALVMLTWEEVEEERRSCLRSAQFTRHAHRCAPCAVGYNHSHKLQEHNLKHSPEAGDEVCDICTIRCKSRAALASHRRRHRARWVCQYCSARFSQACVAADHCSREHGTPPASHRCPHCPHTAQSLGALRMHIKGHSSRPECTLCGKTFRDKSSLRTHAFVHRGEKEHACSVCDKKFMFKKQKEIHEITHMEHQYLYCHQCDVSFKNQTSFYQHMKYNLKHIDPADIKHACKLCDKRFVKAKRLEEHNLAVHLKLAPIKCTVPECTFACPSRAALRSHTRLLHRGARATRTHVCHLCGHTYKSKKSLEGHLRSHNANAPRQV